MKAWQIGVGASVVTSLLFTVMLVFVWNDVQWDPFGLPKWTHSFYPLIGYLTCVVFGYYEYLYFKTKWKQ